MKKPLTYLLMAGVCTGFASAATVAVPYSNSFDSSASDFTSSGVTWSVGGGEYTNTISAANTATSASVSNAALAGQSFTMSTTFDISAVAGTFAGTIGFGAMGDTSSFIAGSATNNLLLVDVSLAGSMRFVTLGSSTATFNSMNWAGGSLALNTSYTMTLTGLYQPDGSVNLSYTFSDGTTSSTLNQTLTAAQAPDGSNFGLRNRTNNATGMTVNFDNFSVGVIPEPSAAALALIGLPLAFARRRRA